MTKELGVALLTPPGQVLVRGDEGRPLLFPTGKPAALPALQSAASSGLAKQFTAVLLPIPRGSQLMMSNRSRASRGKRS